LPDYASINESVIALGAGNISFASRLSQGSDRQGAAGEFSLGPMLMALMRVKKSAGWKAG